EVVPCPQAAAACRALQLSGVGPPAGTTLGGTLTIVLKGARPLSLPYSGILVGARTTVKDIGTVSPPAGKASPTPAPGPPSAPGPSPAASAPVVGRPGEQWARLTW